MAPRRGLGRHSARPFSAGRQPRVALHSRASRESHAGGSTRSREQRTPHATLFVLRLRVTATLALTAQTYSGAVTYDGHAKLALRAAAHTLLANGSLIKVELRRRADNVFGAWRATSTHILGMHMRGTDKVVAKKVQRPWPNVRAPVEQLSQPNIRPSLLRRSPWSIQ